MRLVGVTGKHGSGRLRHRGDDGGLVDTVPLLQLVKDVVGPDDGVLEVRAAFAFEAERLVDVDHDNLAARELDHEVAHGGGCDRGGNPASVFGGELRVALGD